MASSSKHEPSGPDMSIPLAIDQLADELPAQLRKTPLATPVEMASFWLAVALPFLYIPLMLSGITTNGEFLTVLVLLACNVVALFVGHGHRNDRHVE